MMVTSTLKVCAQFFLYLYIITFLLTLLIFKEFVRLVNKPIDEVNEKTDAVKEEAVPQNKEAVVEEPIQGENKFKKGEKSRI